MISKFALVVFLFVQNGLDVQLVNTMNYGRFEEQECHTREVIETKVLPLETGNDARWQYATCVRIEW